jgi:hypothetical protein
MILFVAFIAGGCVLVDKGGGFGCMRAEVKIDILSFVGLA